MLLVNRPLIVTLASSGTQTVSRQPFSPFCSMEVLLGVGGTIGGAPSPLGVSAPGMAPGRTGGAAGGAGVAAGRVKAGVVAAGLLSAALLSAGLLSAGVTGAAGIVALVGAAAAVVERTADPVTTTVSPQPHELTIGEPQYDPPEQPQEETGA